jgi:hypothetical protein
MKEGIVICYFPFFSEKNHFSEGNDIHLNKISSWSYIDASFNDYFLNVFSKNSKIKSIPENILSNDAFNYEDDLSNCNFTFETKLKYKDYKYLNVIKCGFHFENLSVDQIQELSKIKTKELFKVISNFDIPELRNKAKVIKEQLFSQKIKFQIVLIDNKNLSFSERKYTLLDLALDRHSGTAKKTVEHSAFQNKQTHSKFFLNTLADQSIIDQYQDWTTIISYKKIITIYYCDSLETIRKFLLNNSVQFGLIYIQKIVISELISILNLWVNENKFENNLELSKYFLRFSRSFDFKIISTKNVYNEYSRFLDQNLKINEEKVIINEKIKEIEDILIKEKNQSNNLLLFTIALLQLMTVFKDEIKEEIAYILHFNIYKINLFFIVFLLIISILIIYLFLKKRKI